MEKKNALSELLQENTRSTNHILEILAMNGGELDPELEKALSHVDPSLPAAIDNQSNVLDRLEAEADYWASKAEACTRFARGINRARDYIKDSIKTAMRDAGLSEISGLDSRFVLCNSKPALQIDKDNLDTAYLMKVTTTEVDKKRIEEDLKLGIPVKGASLLETKSLRVYLNPGGKKK